MKSSERLGNKKTKRQISSEKFEIQFAENLRLLNDLFSNQNTSYTPIRGIIQNNITLDDFSQLYDLFSL